MAEQPTTQERAIQQWKAEAKEIAVGGRGVNIRNFAEMWKVADIIHKSGTAPDGLNTPEKVFVAIETGAELGLPAMKSLSSICVIKGSPSIWGNAPLGIVQGSGALKSWNQWFEADGKRLSDSDAATKEIGENWTACFSTHRNGQTQPHVSRYSVSDAKRAGLWMRRHRNGGDSTWVTSPKDMLMFKAMHRNLGRQFADVLSGIPISEFRNVAEMRAAGTDHATPSEPDPILSDVIVADYTVTPDPVLEGEIEQQRQTVTHNENQISLEPVADHEQVSSETRYPEPSTDETQPPLALAPRKEPERPRCTARPKVEPKQETALDESQRDTLIAAINRTTEQITKLPEWQRKIKLAIRGDEWDAASTIPQLQAMSSAMIELRDTLEEHGKPDTIDALCEMAVGVWKKHT